MAIAGSEVNQAAFSQEVQDAAISQFIAFNIVTGFEMAYSQIVQVVFIDFYVEMTGIGQDDAVVHLFQMFLADDVFVACKGNKNIAHFSSFFHGHDFKAVENSFNSLNGVYFRNDDVGAQAFRPHSTAAAAPAIAGNDNAFAYDREVRRTHNTIPRGLTCAIAVIKEVFAVRIVRCNHREF